MDLGGAIQTSSSSVLIELFDDICPKTCVNFKALCAGVTHDGKKLSY